jgi:periplasmic protein TonB
MSLAMSQQNTNSVRPAVIGGVIALHAVFLLALLSIGTVAIPRLEEPITITLLNNKPIAASVPPMPIPVLPVSEARFTDVAAAIPLVTVATPQDSPKTMTLSLTTPAISAPSPSVSSSTAEAQLEPHMALVHETELSYIRTPEIRRPPASKRAGEHGIVYLMIVIDEEGLVCQVQIERSSLFERLDMAAMRAMRTARFQPVIRNGVPVAVRAIVPVEFPT